MVTVKFALTKSKMLLGANTPIRASLLKHASAGFT